MWPRGPIIDPTIEVSDITPSIKYVKGNGDDQISLADKRFATGHALLHRLKVEADASGMELFSHAVDDVLRNARRR